MAGLQPSPDWCGKELTCCLKAGNDEQIRGEVFAFDVATDTLVLKENAVGQHLATYRLLKGESLDLSTVALRGTTVVPEPVPPVSQATLDRIREKEEQAVAKELAKGAMIGENVSREAQLLFNGLAKTMRCKWDKQDILVLLEPGDRPESGVRISSPYTVDLVQGRNEEFVARVKKVLEGERARISA
eukprot:CAMPEP_0181290252 /NCGR_PEP_ID=MMETSP1101-20121128/1316_1 /TAXON_ID=46948 /ORGANISM="Rhodomonas abbreviata, Strain Caron Lab Isolate" /LENGTH=186 /DNA_ID=CAMNT_0023394527 /DNA_START=13 /DNA_END=573 /DNA_ORIENTATION=+